MSKRKAVKITAADVRQKKTGGARNLYYDELKTDFESLPVGESFVVPMSEQPKEKKVEQFAAHVRAGLKARDVSDFTVQYHADNKSIILTKEKPAAPAESEA